MVISFDYISINGVFTLYAFSCTYVYYVFMFKLNVNLCKTVFNVIVNAGLNKRVRDLVLDMSFKLIITCNCVLVICLSLIHKDFIYCYNVLCVHNMF